MFVVRVLTWTCRFDLQMSKISANLRANRKTRGLNKPDYKIIHHHVNWVISHWSCTLRPLSGPCFKRHLSTDSWRRNEQKIPQLTIKALWAVLGVRWPASVVLFHVVQIVTWGSLFLAQGGRPQRLSLASTGTKFNAWCSRCLGRGTPTRLRIFYTYVLGNIGSRLKKAFCHTSSNTIANNVLHFLVRETLLITEFWPASCIEKQF